MKRDFLVTSFYSDRIARMTPAVKHGVILAWSRGKDISAFLRVNEIPWEEFHRWAYKLKRYGYAGLKANFRERTS